MVATGSLSEPGVKTSEPTKAAREESVSSESESEEEAEYHPNVSVSIARTQIPEEKEEELEEGDEKETLVEPDTAAPDVTSAAAEVSQPVAAASPEEEEARTVKKNAEEEEKEEEEEEEVVGADEVPVMPPEEANPNPPNGVILSVEAATETPAHTEEEEEPKMNGEASLAEAESRPQVICCSEVKSSLGPLVELPQASTLPPDLAAPVYISFPLLSVWVSPSCLCEHRSPVCDLTLVLVPESPPESNQCHHPLTG